MSKQLTDPTKAVTWYVYSPVKWRRELGYKRVLNRCAGQTYDAMFGFGQCSRKPKITIQGYGFCTQHAKRAAKGMGIELPQGEAGGQGETK